MTITLAFQKKMPNPTWKDKLEMGLIKWKTKSDYFHVEAIIKNKWVTAHPKTDGVVIRELQPLDEDYYDYITIDVDGRKIRSVMKYIKSQEGKKYDWLGIFFAQVFGKNINDREKWFCSELIAEILMKLDIMDADVPSYKYSPQDVYEFVKLIKFLD
jgi:hypothetical protein